MQTQLEQLYNPLLSYVKKRVNNHEDAQDITQEVFYKLSKSNNDQINNLKSWVYTIAKNTITDYYRKSKVDTVEAEGSLVDQKSEDNIAVRELSKCVNDYIDMLPEEYRKIMIMSELEDISQKEIAARLNMNYVTVRSKIQRGRKKLKQLLSECCTIIQGGKGSIMQYINKEGKVTGDCDSCS